MERARLAVVASRWGPSRGGEEALLSDLAGALAADGVEVTVLCREGDDPRPGVAVEGIDVPAWPRARAERLFRREASRRALASGGPLLATRPVPSATHVQLHGGLLDDAFAAEREAARSPLRRALFPIGDRLNPKRRFLLAEERAVLSRSPRPRLMVWSAALRDRVVSVHGVPAPEVAVLPPGVDLALFSPGEEPPPAGRLDLLFAGRPFALKGLATAIEALARLVASGAGARLLVAGGDEPGPYDRLARRLGVGGRVEFLGRLPRGQMPALYRRCHALVHPTFHDPFSLVALEALACGCPVATSRRNGASEVIAGGREGFLLDDPRDAAALCASLSSLADPVRSTAMRMAAAALGARFPLSAFVREVRAWLGL